MNGFTFDYLLGDPNYKLLIDEITVGATKTIYIGKASYTSSSITPDTSKAIWQIIRIEETTAGTDVDTDRSIPLSIGVLTPVGTPTTLQEMIWDDRAILTYI